MLSSRFSIKKARKLIGETSGYLRKVMKPKEKTGEFPIKFSGCFNNNPHMQQIAGKLFSDLELYNLWQESLNEKLENDLCHIPFVNIIKWGHMEGLIKDINMFHEECDYDDGFELNSYLENKFPEIIKEYWHRFLSNKSSFSRSRDYGTYTECFDGPCTC